MSSRLGSKLGPAGWIPSPCCPSLMPLMSLTSLDAAFLAARYNVIHRNSWESGLAPLFQGRGLASSPGHRASPKPECRRAPRPRTPSRPSGVLITATIRWRQGYLVPPASSLRPRRTMACEAKATCFCMHFTLPTKYCRLHGHRGIQPRHHHGATLAYFDDMLVL